MIRSTIFRVDSDGFATAVFHAQSDTPVASSYLQVLFDPHSDQGVEYLCVQEPVPPVRPDPWDGPIRIQWWLRPAARHLPDHPRPRRPVFVWTWDPAGPVPGWARPAYQVPLRPRLVAVEVVASDGRWRDDDPVVDRFDLSGLLPDEALLRRDDLTRIHGGRGDQRLREIWSRP